MVPAVSKGILWIKKEQWFGEWETHVYYNIPNDESNYGLELTPWNEVLGMKVCRTSPTISNVEVVARILFEITFMGFSEEQIEDRVEELRSRYREYNAEQEAPEDEPNQEPGKDRSQEKLTAHPRKRNKSKH